MASKIKNIEVLELGDAPLDREKYHVEIAGCPPSPYTILAALNAGRGGSNSRRGPGSASMEVR